MADNLSFEIIKLVVAAAGGVAAFIAGRNEYRKSVRVKRAEFLDKLISDFQHKETEIARNILDDYVYVTEEMNNMTPVEQKLNATPLKEYLRDHKIKPIINMDEIRVRRSFDALFDFFTRLAYYLSNKLITPGELTYFRFYLEKMEIRSDDISAYISTYFYREDFETLYQAIKTLRNKMNSSG